MTVEQKFKSWYSSPLLTEELKMNLAEMDEAEMNDSFYRNLAFGTGGLRGILGAGTNRMNVFTVIKATRGLGCYLLREYSNPSCAISCDSRIHSRDFAEVTAAVLAEMGIQVWIYPLLQPTPMLSFAVRFLSAAAGVMITASHNPAKYNGYKVYGNDGCQITLEAAEKIQRSIDDQPDLPGSIPSFEDFLASGRIRYIGNETIEAYYRSILDLRVHVCNEPLHVVYSPLNGAGNVPVREILHRLGNVTVTVVPEQEKPDGHFPTCPYPNPEIRDAMSLSIRKALETGADLCFATDPDSDRMGAGINQNGHVELISGNDMGILLLDYLCRYLSPAERNLPRVVIKTIVTTDMAEALCHKYGLELRNVLTGFKFIGEQIAGLEKEGNAERFLFGFEESCGYLSGTEVRDKDAVNASMLLCDMAADLKSRGLTLFQRLEELRAEFGIYSQRLLTYQYEGESGSERMKKIMKDLRQPLEHFENSLFRHSSRLDYLTDNTGLPQSDVIEFRPDDNQKIIIRPSGTEPKLKAYLFARACDTTLAEKALSKLEEAVNGICG